MLTPESPQIRSAGIALFKRVVTITSAVCLAAFYSWLACHDLQKADFIHFHWHWIALLWSVIGACSCTYCFHKIWPPPRYHAATRKGMIKGLIVLILPGLWWIRLPLRLFTGTHLWDVVSPFVIVAMALSYGAWMVRRLIRFFERSDANDLNYLNSEEQNVETNSIDN